MMDNESFSILTFGCLVEAEDLASLSPVLEEVLLFKMFSKLLDFKLTVL